MKTMLAVAVLLCLAPGVRAQEFIGAAQLMRACTGNAPGDRQACDGFLAGALDQVFVNPELKGKLCLPAGTKLGALRDGLDKFARSHADAVKGPAIALVDDMVKTTFPCPAK